MWICVLNVHPQYNFFETGNSHNSNECKTSETCQTCPPTACTNSSTCRNSPCTYCRISISTRISIPRFSTGKIMILILIIISLIAILYKPEIHGTGCIYGYCIIPANDGSARNATYVGSARYDTTYGTRRSTSVCLPR